MSDIMNEVSKMTDDRLAIEWHRIACIPMERVTTEDRTRMLALDFEGMRRKYGFKNTAVSETLEKEEKS